EQKVGLRSRPVGLTEIERAVERGLAEEKPRVARTDIDGNAGMARIEIRQARDQPFRADGGERCDVENRAIGFIAHDLERIALDALDRLRDARAVSRPGMRQGDPLLDAVKKLDAELPLQLRDLA